MKCKFLSALVCVVFITLPTVCLSAQSQSEENLLNQEISQQSVDQSKGMNINKIARNFNPEISLIIDTNYYTEDADEPVSELLEEASGFGHGHGGGHGHSHGTFEEGFNLQEVELFLSGAVDPYFKAYATIAFSEEDSEVEEAVFQTTSLPYGLQILGGKFLSHFDRINRQHPHSWDFVNRPLIHELAIGGEGLNEKGLVWSGTGG